MLLNMYIETKLGELDAELDARRRTSLDAYPTIRGKTDRRQPPHHQRRPMGSQRSFAIRGGGAR